MRIQTPCFQCLYVCLCVEKRSHFIPNIHHLNRIFIYKNVELRSIYHRMVSYIIHTHNHTRTTTLEFWIKQREFIIMCGCVRAHSGRSHRNWEIRSCWKKCIARKYFNLVLGLKTWNIPFLPSLFFPFFSRWLYKTTFLLYGVVVGAMEHFVQISTKDFCYTPNTFTMFIKHIQRFECC